jgi:type VI protein secretion system component Hcp
VLDQVLTLPTITWDASTSNREIIIQLATTSNEATPTTLYGAYTSDDDGSIFLTSDYLKIDGSNTWTNDKYQSVDDSTSSVTFSTGSGALYPVTTAPVWTLFEAEQTVPFTGIVDENGPWRSGSPPPVGNTNYTWYTAEVDRTDFGIPHTSSYVPTWLGVRSSDDQVIVWIANNTVIPVGDTSTITYPADAIEEVYSAGLYGFESFVIKARLRPDPSPEWNPQVHSGWFYEQQQEYYLYADRTEAVSTASDSVNLDGVAHQGAPIIVWTDEATPHLLRQIAFSDSTPEFSLSTTQTITGNNTDILYLAYQDVYDVTVVDHDTNESVGAATSTETNELQLDVASSKLHRYDVSYTVNRSFYAIMNYNDNGSMCTRLVFDQVGIT